MPTEPQGEKVQIVISTPTSKKDEGYILLDTIIALLILCLTLTATYGLFIKAFKLEETLNSSMDEILNEGNKYDEYIETIFKE